MVLTDVNYSITVAQNSFLNAKQLALESFTRGKLTDLQTPSPASLHLDSIFYIKHLR